MIISKLENGITFAYIKTSNKYCSVLIGANAGYAYDPPRKISLTHLYEHIFLGMLNKLYGFDNQLENLGFTSNGETGKNYIELYFENYSKNLYKNFTSIKNLINNFSVSKDVFDAESKALINEVSDYYADEYNLICDISEAKCFNHKENKRYEPKRLKLEISLLDVLKWHTRIFSKNNIVVIISGKINKSEYNSIKDILSKISLFDAKILPNEKSKNLIPNIKTKKDYGVIGFNVSNPTVNDFACEKILENIYVNYDDGIIFNLVRNKNTLSYGAYHHGSFGIGERVFEFIFRSPDKTELKKLIARLKVSAALIRQNRTDFKRGIRRAIIQEYKLAEGPMEYLQEIYYTYAACGKLVDLKGMINYISSINYKVYKLWIKRLKRKIFII